MLALKLMGSGPVSRMWSSCAAKYCKAMYFTGLAIFTFRRQGWRFTALSIENILSLANLKTSSGITRAWLHHLLSLGSSKLPLQSPIIWQEMICPAHVEEWINNAQPFTTAGQPQPYKRRQTRTKKWLWTFINQTSQPQLQTLWEDEVGA